MLTPQAITDAVAIVLDEDAKLLTRISAIEDLRIHLRAFQATLVEEARSGRKGIANWDEIGAVLGITKQAAQQRFRWAEID